LPQLQKALAPAKSPTEAEWNLQLRTNAVNKAKEVAAQPTALGTLQKAIGVVPAPAAQPTALETLQNSLSPVSAEIKPLLAAAPPPAGALDKDEQKFYTKTWQPDFSPPPAIDPPALQARLENPFGIAKKPLYGPFLPAEPAPPTWGEKAWESLKNTPEAFWNGIKSFFVKQYWDLRSNHDQRTGEVAAAAARAPRRSLGRVLVVCQRPVESCAGGAGYKESGGGDRRVLRQHSRRRF